MGDRGSGIRQIITPALLGRLLSLHLRKSQITNHFGRLYAPSVGTMFSESITKWKNLSHEAQAATAKISRSES